MSSSSRQAAKVVTDADIQRYADAIIAYKNNANYDHKKLADTIAKYLPSTIVRIIKYKPELAEFFEKEPELTKRWSAQLKKKNFYSGTIEAVNGNDKCSVLDRYQGIYYYNKWKNSPASYENLDNACKTKIFEALVARTNFNVTNIKRDPNIIAVREQLHDDVVSLSNLYWLPGTVHAALILTELGIYYAAKPDEQQVRKIYFAAALELILTANKLTDLADNNELSSIGKELTEYIYKGKDLKTILGGQFDDWEQAKLFFFNQLHISSTSDPHFIELLEAWHKNTALNYKNNL